MFGPEQQREWLLAQFFFFLYSSSNAQVLSKNWKDPVFIWLWKFNIMHPLDSKYIQPVRKKNI